MYLNNIHILFYVLFCILGIISGQIASWCTKRMPDHKKVITKDFFKEFKINYPLIIITVIIYMILLVMHGIKGQFLNNLQLIKYVILTPMIISAFLIDYKHQIIPNRLNLTIFEVGLSSAIVSGFYNMNLLTDAILGLIAGGGIFLIITLIGGLIAGKEAMGFGDVKFMAALRTIFWIRKYHNDNINGFPICSSNKYIFTCYKNQKEKRIYTIWTIYSNCVLNKYDGTI